MNRRLMVFFHALLFVLGFSVVFVLGWGGAATLLGQLFGAYKGWLGKIGGAVVILFGLSTLGVVKIPWLYYHSRPEWQVQHRRGLLASGAMGLFIAATGRPASGVCRGFCLIIHK